MTKREEFGRKFILIILTFWMITEVLFSTTIDNIFFWEKNVINGTVDYIILCMLLVQIIFFQSYKFREIMIIGLITLFIIFTTIQSGHNTIMSTWIFIVASKNIDFDLFIKIAYYVQLFMFILVIYLFISGYIKDYVVFRGVVTRHSLGFSHPNQLGVRVFLINVCRLYYRRKRINLFDILVIIISAYMVKEVANSQTSFYALIILTLISFVFLLNQFWGFNIVLFSNIAIFVACISNIGSIILSMLDLSRYPILKRIDMVLSVRFSMCHMTMMYYGVKMLGQNIQLIVKKPIIGVIRHFWIDNAYMAILLRYGVVIYLIFSIMYIVTMILLKKTNQMFLLFVFALYSVYGIMENNFFSMSQNMFLIAISFTLFSNMRADFTRSFKKIQIVW